MVLRTVQVVDPSPLIEASKQGRLNVAERPEKVHGAIAITEAEFSTSPADAAQAFVNRIVFPSHVLQRLHRLGVAGRLGLALGGERSGLTRVTCFPVGPGLDEPALLHRCQSRSSADREAQQNRYKQIQRRWSLRLAAFSIWHVACQPDWPT